MCYHISAQEVDLLLVNLGFCANQKSILLRTSGFTTSGTLGEIRKKSPHSPLWVGENHCITASQASSSIFKIRSRASEREMSVFWSMEFRTLQI